MLIPHVNDDESCLSHVNVDHLIAGEPLLPTDATEGARTERHIQIGGEANLRCLPEHGVYCSGAEIIGAETPFCPSTYLPKRSDQKRNAPDHCL